MSKESFYEPPLEPESQLEVLRVLNEAMSSVVGNDALVESLDEVRRQLAFEDQGWQKWWGSAWGVSDDNAGLTLEDVMSASEEIRSHIIGGSLLKNGVEIRSGYIWSKGISIPGTERSGTAGRPSAVAVFAEKQTTKECFLSATAHYEMEKAAYSDGNFLILGEDTSKDTHRVSIRSVAEILTNPQFVEETWAYRLSLPNPNPANPKPDVFWVYTDRFPTAKRKQSITTNNQTFPVRVDHTIFDARFNRQTGYTLGTPDALPAIAWSRAYSQGMKGGLQMQKALAYLAFKVTNKSASGAAAAGVKVAAGTRGGNTATMVDGQDMNPLSSAGKGYDFSSLRDVAGMIAASIQISVVALLASPGAAGSSYGAAATLDKPQRDAMRQRQSVWSDFIGRVFKWATDKNVEIIFPPIDDPDSYREMQEATLPWTQGVLHPEEYRAKVLSMLHIVTEEKSAPKGVLIPNNQFSEPRNDIDPGGSAYSGPDSNNLPTQAASPDQGQSSGVGAGAQKAIRQDVLAQMLDTTYLDRLRELVERLEVASPK